MASVTTLDLVNGENISETAFFKNSTEMYLDADNIEQPVLVKSERTLKIIYFIIGTIGVLGNVLVVCVILNYRKMLKSTTNLYIINQSLIDGMVAAIIILRNVFEDHGRYFYNVADDLLCKLWLTNVPLWGLLVSSSYNLILMSLEKYVAVVHPIWHKNHWSKSKATISLVSAWIIGVFYQGAFKIPTTLIKDGKCYAFQIWPSLATRRAVGVVTVAVQYFAPLFLLCFFYGRMLAALKKRTGGSTNNSGGNTQKGDHMARAKRNVIKTLIFVSGFYVACWTCSQTYFLLFNLGQPLSLSSPFYHFTVIAVFFNCCINPFIYVTKYDQFKTGLRKLAQDISGGRLGKVTSVDNQSSVTETTANNTMETTA